MCESGQAAYALAQAKPSNDSERRTIMRKLFAVTLIAASLVGATAAFAVVPETTVEAFVRSVDTAANTVTLTDGVTLTAGPRLSIEPLQPGEAATFMYQQDSDGRNVLTAFWIDEGPGGMN